MTTYENTPEDALVSRIIRFHKETVDPDPEDDEIYPTDVHKIEPEAHYNHYGNKGSADLYAVERTIYEDRPDYLWGTLYEVKSAHAVEEASGANEIVRQFNKMRRYFFQDETRERPDNIHYVLCFLVCPTTVQHVAENREIYAQIPEHDDRLSVSVHFRAPDGEFQPGHPFTEPSVEKSLLYSRPEFAPHLGLDREEIQAIAQELGMSEWWDNRWQSALEDNSP